MVELGGRALRFVVDSTFVVLEGRFRSIDGNRDWCTIDSGLEIRLRSFRDIGVGSNSRSTVLCVVEATGSSFSGVRIAGFGINSLIGNDVLEGIVHQTTFTSHVSLFARAVNKVLFREGNQVSSGELVASFSGSSGREGPAGTALLLVLDWSNSALSSPVPCTRKSLDESRRNVSVSLSNESRGINDCSKVEFAEFLVGKIRKFVDSNSKGSVRSFVESEVVNKVYVFLEDFVSVICFVVVVRLVVLGSERLPCVKVLRL